MKGVYRPSPPCPNALVVTGGESDVCVLAAVMDAVDLGYRVVLGTDALCSSSDRTHDAVLTLFREKVQRV